MSGQERFDWCASCANQSRCVVIRTLKTRPKVPCEMFDWPAAADEFCPSRPLRRWEKKEWRTEGEDLGGAPREK